MARLPRRLVLTPEKALELEAFLNEMTVFQGASPACAKAYRRALALWYSFKHGWGIPQISKHFGQPERTVWSWFKAYRQLGVNGLIDQRLRETIPDWRGLETVLKPRPDRLRSVERGLVWRQARVAAEMAVLKQPTQPRAPQSRIMTPPEAADYLRISRTKLYRLARAGKLPACKLGRTWRFRYADLYEFLMQQTRTLVKKGLPDFPH